jgi:VWFA-related protein
LLAAVATGLAAAIVIPARAQQTPPTFRSGVDVVEVTAVVTDRDGNPVRDLTADDFEILEDGQPRDITSFVLVDLPIVKAGSRPVGVETDVISNAGDPGRLYVIAMGGYSDDAGMRVRQIVRDFVERHFGPNDTAAVVYIGQTHRKNAQPFTTNRRLLLNAIDRSAQAGGTGQRPMAALRELVDSVARLDHRRKTILFVSVATPDIFSVVDYNGGVKSLEFDDFQQAVGAALRGNVTIYALDPRGLVAAPSFMLSESAPPVDSLGAADAIALEARAGMRSLADFTGGFGIVNQNDFEGGIARMVRENSTYYVLGYVSADSRRDNRFRPLRVRVRRPGLEVRARSGYVALKDGPAPATARIAAPTSPQLRAAVASPTTSPGVPLRVFAAPFRADRGRNAIVPIVITVDPTALGLVEQDGSFNGELEIGHFATDWRNRIIPGRFFVADLKLRPVTYQRAGAGIRILSEARLPPGQYQLRVGAANGSDRNGTVVYDLEVPDFSKRGVSMSGVLLATAIDEELVVRHQDPLRDLMPVVPTTARTFTAADTLIVSAAVYANGGRSSQPLTAAIELRSTGGRRIQGTSRQIQPADMPRGEHLLTETVRLDGVAPGSYVIQVEARSTADPSAAVVRQVPIDVR